jgi:DNA-directed RNA polymerase specialized sigma24 family protein
VIRCLITYTDWWQPSSASVYTIAGAQRSLPEGLRPGLLEHLDERTELCRRMQLVSARDRQLLFLWYVRQLSVEEIAREVRLSRRQCFRRRASAIRKLMKLDDSDEAA